MVTGRGSGPDRHADEKPDVAADLEIVDGRVADVGGHGFLAVACDHPGEQLLGARERLGPVASRHVDPSRIIGTRRRSGS